MTEKQDRRPLLAAKIFIGSALGAAAGAVVLIVIAGTLPTGLQFLRGLGFILIFAAISTATEYVLGSGRRQKDP